MAGVDRFDRKTDPFISAFELTKVLAHRAAQLDRGGRPAIDTEGETDPVRVAMLELSAGCLRLSIHRDAPGGTFEDWDVGDLINLHDHPLLPKPPRPPVGGATSKAAATKLVR